MNKLKKGKMEKGITLIALIITIIVLLILAIVTIGAIKNDGLIQYAQNARKDYTDASNKEQEALNTLFDKIEGNVPGNSGENTTMTVAKAQEKGVLSTTANIDVVDEYGNIVKVPAGFKITTDASNVTQGIVIEDCTEAATKGSQFVWVPVGTIYTNTSKTESKTITLGRYAYEEYGDKNDYIKNENGEYVPVQKAEDYATKVDIWDSRGHNVCREETADNHTCENAIAKDIGAFYTNTIKNGGYYIGRYEAGDLESTNANTERTEETGRTNTLVCKSNQRVYNYVTQLQASSLSQDMYKNAATFTSDLINSYAWDTAIIFIQTFGGCEDYYDRNFSRSFANTGINNDKYCNIYDMSGNAMEWSTETSSRADIPCVVRGGFYFNADDGGAWNSPSFRLNYSTTDSGSDYSFRTILYL